MVLVRFQRWYDVGALVVVLGAALVSVHADGPGPTNLTPVIEPIRQKFNAPGVAAAVVRDGKLVALGASGVRGIEKKEPVAPSDRSMIGSCGKSATRLLIGRLVDKGKLRWDSTLGELLADVPMRDEYKSVTIGDIIGHRGGLQSYENINPKKTPILFNQPGSPREQRAAFITHLLSEPPAAAPRTRFVYSNAGYGLLGHIAERLADKPYEQLLRDEVFRPLDMQSAIVGMPGSASNIPSWVGHLRNKKEFEPAPARSGLAGIAPAGLMSMSVEDFAKLAAALVQVESRKPSEFLGSAAVEKLPELRPGSSGEGEIFFGGDGHYTAAFALWPSKGLGIVVESNAGDSDDVCSAIVKAVRSVVDPGGESGDLAQTGGPQRERYGLRLQVEAEDEGMSILALEPGSVAEKAGLKEGDKILAVNNTLLEKLSPEDRTAAFKKSPLVLRIEREGKPLDFTLHLP